MEELKCVELLGVRRYLVYDGSSAEEWKDWFEERGVRVVCREVGEGEKVEIEESDW